MNNRYPRNRKRSPSAECPHCGKTYSTMGMGTHIREAHKMLYKTTVITTTKPVATTTVKPIAKPVATVTIAKPTAIITQELSNITGKDLTECKRPDGKHLYVDQDIWILLGRISRVMLATNLDNLLSRWDSENTCHELIRDFEQRFECTFSDVKKVNVHIKPGKTNIENSEIASRYAHLKYSRTGGFLQENWTQL